MTYSTSSAPQGERQRNASVERLVLGILDAVEELLSEDIFMSSTTTITDTFDNSHQHRSDDGHDCSTTNSCSLSRELPRREVEGRHQHSRTSSLLSLYKAAQVVHVAQSEMTVSTRTLTNSRCEPTSNDDRV